MGVRKNAKAIYKQALSKSIATFHALSPIEKNSIQQQRLRIVPAKSQETLAALLKRTGSDWEEQACAVANNLQVGDTLKKGQLVKVVKSEPYNTQ